MESRQDSPGRYSARDRLRSVFTLQMMAILPIYFLFLIPLASGLAWAGRWVDKKILHLPDFVPWPWNLAAFAACFLAGGVFLVWCYSYLILEGEGGPVPPFSKKTKFLVKTGPYALVRHPSIIAKLVGVVGLGILFNSVTFTLVIVPLLLAGSLINNYLWQEKPMLAFFGEEYARYRSETPLFIPRFADLLFKKRR